MHDLLLSKGFSQTHVYVLSIPQDGMLLQMEACGCVKGVEEFWQLGDQKHAVGTSARGRALQRKLWHQAPARPEP